MPATRRSYAIAETDEVARALRDAARRWPQDEGRPARLLVNLVREGHRAIVGQAEGAVGDRRAAIERTRGALTGSYERGYLDELQGDWEG